MVELVMGMPVGYSQFMQCLTLTPKMIIIFFSVLTDTFADTVTDHDGGAGDDVPDLSDSDNEEQWQWMEANDNVQVTCLFCDKCVSLFFFKQLTDTFNLV